MDVATGHDIVVVGAGILGLASAYHILQAGRGLDLPVLDRLPGGGQAVDREGGYYLEPTIFAGVPPESRLAQQEIFGPVLAVIRARDFDEAVQIFNGTDYGLTGGLCSRSRERIERAEREFYVGNLYINRKITGALVGTHPFGGFKMSGANAKAGGPDYLRLFLEMKSVAEHL